MSDRVQAGRRIQATGSDGGALPGLSADIGVHPAVRAAVGLLLGVALGVLAGLLVPRRRDR